MLIEETQNSEGYQVHINDELRLQQLCSNLSNNNKQKKSLEKEINNDKEEATKLMTKLGLESFTYGDSSIKMTVLDKSYLNEEAVLKYLRDKGLEKYIKTKEYFDPSEIIMASAHGEINIAELQQFKIKKEQTNFYIK